MEYSVTVQPSGYSFNVYQHETILEAALRQGYFFPHKCRNAICGTCKGKLLSGEIDYGNVVIRALNAEEQKSYILFCSAKPKSDLVIEVLGFESIQKPVPQTALYQVVHQELLANNISRLILQTNSVQPIPYQAGQYIKILHADSQVSPMSIACAPFDISTIELHLYHPAENVLALDLLALAQTKKQFIVRGPYGTCTLEKIDLSRPLIFIANGTGVTPIKAIMEEFLRMKSLPEIHLFFSGENYIAPLLESWSQKLKTFHYSFVDNATLSILENYPDLSQHQVYMVDMENVVYDALFQFMQHGLAKEWFYSDVFDYDSAN